MAVRITLRLADHHTEHALFPAAPGGGDSLCEKKQREEGREGSEEEVIRSRSAERGRGRRNQHSGAYGPHGVHGTIHHRPNYLQPLPLVSEEAIAGHHSTGCGLIKEPKVKLKRNKRL